MSKHKKTGHRQPKNLGDVTINDFANSTVCKNRVKKSNDSVNIVLKQIEVDKSWDEKDYDADFDFVEEENEDGTISYVMKKIDLQSKKKGKLHDDMSNRPGKDYPLDLWYIISDYLIPEDVGTFSCICKSSYAVINTAKFWFGLYKRCYTSIPSLPERLQPECMQRMYGVRTSVIRSLFYMYTPYINRLKSIKSEEHPEVLLKRQCVLMWHEKKRTQWVYYFKLKENGNISLTHRNRPARQPDLIEMLEDISANNDDNCRILQVSCTNFVHTPSLQGLALTSVGITLSHGFRHNRVQLGFSSCISVYTSCKLGGSSSIAVTLDPVINVRILDWWHPLYPHNYNIELLLNQE